MKVAAFQMDVEWESPHTNREKVLQWVQTFAADADIIVLPEMFSTGFSMNPEHIAEEMTGETVQWLKQTAIKTGKAFVASIAIRAQESISQEWGFFNRLFFISPEGVSMCYDKRHLFRMGEEHKFYKEGHGKTIIHYKGFRILPLICYDLRFPVWSRNRNDYDMLIYIASWPAVRSDVWKTLLRARAIENLAYVVGVNRCGSDPQLEYTGDTAIIDFKGEPLVEATPAKQEMIMADLQMQPLLDFREKFPAHLDADSFSIHINNF